MSDVSDIVYSNCVGVSVSPLLVPQCSACFALLDWSCDPLFFPTLPMGVLQRFNFQFSSPQPTPLSTGHSLSAPPLDESVEPSGLYAKLVGCLMYLMTCTRPDLAYPLSLFARFGLPYIKDGARAWRTGPRATCLTYLLTDLGEQPRSPPVLYVDNKAMIAMCYEHRTKHIALRYFLALELKQRGQLRLAYGATRANSADVFTKALPPGDHLRFAIVLGLRVGSSSGGGMEVFFWAVFGALVVLCAGLEGSKGQRDKLQTSPAFDSFKNNYLLVYSLMMAGDWLQGPYVYALYQHYGYDKGDIGRLFIAGFGSSMVFGTIVGSLADKHGRRRASLTYCGVYVLSCLTKHSPDYRLLMLGRVLGGIATSLLFSAFESWLVAEHFKRGFEAQWLSVTFSSAIWLGNGLVAILSGLLANSLVTSLALGPVAPFDAAALVLLVGGTIIAATWPENYGDSSDSKGLLAQFHAAASAIASDEKIALLGAIQSLFEGSMYTFVFLWTPALAPSDQRIPHGFIFAIFMLASMTGSSLAARLMARPTLRVELYMQIIFAVSSLSLLVPLFAFFVLEPLAPDGGGITAGGRVQLVGFCVFEVCVGVFWPSMMKMRSQFIPEEARATIMNFFRIPLNCFVCIVLYNVSAFPITAMFGMCSIFLAMAAVLQRRLFAISSPGKPGTPACHCESSHLALLIAAFHCHCESSHLALLIAAFHCHCESSHLALLIAAFHCHCESSHLALLIAAFHCHFARESVARLPLLLAAEPVTPVARVPVAPVASVPVAPVARVPIAPVAPCASSFSCRPQSPLLS
ncbi:unnamed protein product [Closterium sp. NIES-53]